MNRDVYPGALYVHQLVTGERVVLYPYSHLDTHLGRIAFPPGESYGLLFLHCTNVPEFKFSGLSHDVAGSQMEWSQSRGWQRAVYLTGRTVYDRQGVLRDTTPAGYQFVNDAGEPVSRLIAYEPRHGVSEWSETAGLVIGQGHQHGGVVVWDGTHLRRLDTGECYFVIVDRVGEQVCLSYVRAGEGAIVVTGTLSELRALPILNKEPEKPVPVAPNKIAVVQSVIAAHPDINRLKDGPFAPNRGGITQAVARALGFPWGRKSKDGSETNLSDDALTYRLQDNRFEIYDILDGTTGAATWDYKGTFRDGENGYFIVPGAVPVDVPPSSIDALVEARIVAAVAPLVKRIAALEARPNHKPESLDGRKVALRTADGHYLCAENGGGGDVNATRDAVGGWETFTVESQS